MGSAIGDIRFLCGPVTTGAYSLANDNETNRNRRRAETKAQTAAGAGATTIAKRRKQAAKSARQLRRGSAVVLEMGLARWPTLVWIQRW